MMGISPNGALPSPVDMSATTQRRRKVSPKMKQRPHVETVSGTPGYCMFVKSLTDEILKRNPSADKIEMQRIVNQEWYKLPEDQKQVYEKLSHQ